jgi:hypothetical protein
MEEGGVALGRSQGVGEAQVARGRHVEQADVLRAQLRGGGLEGKEEEKGGEGME